MLILWREFNFSWNAAPRPSRECCVLRSRVSNEKEHYSYCVHGITLNSSSSDLLFCEALFNTVLLQVIFLDWMNATAVLLLLFFRPPFIFRIKPLSQQGASPGNVLRADKIINRINLILKADFKLTTCSVWKTNNQLLLRSMKGFNSSLAQQGIYFSLRGNHVLTSIIHWLV